MCISASGLGGNHAENYFYHGFLQCNCFGWVGARNGKYDDTIYAITTVHCAKSVHVWSCSGPTSVRTGANMDQNSSEYGHFSRSGCYITNSNDFFFLHEKLSDKILARTKFTDLRTKFLKVVKNHQCLSF